MLLPKPFVLLLLVFCCCCCNKSHKYSYAIKDFRTTLQPYLTDIVDRGIVISNDSILRNIATDDELIRLGRSEHPILRATAFREMLTRRSFDHFDILMEHLDDTALVATDAGEFGIWYRTVSDDILRNAGWKTQEAKEKTIKQVLTQHNYLSSAYLILLHFEPKEMYYPFIRDMATRPTHLNPIYGDKPGFADIEFALYGLAKFRKKEDVALIKKKLMQHIRELSDVSFRLMKEYPDTAYLEVLQTYHQRRFYRFSGEEAGGFTGSDANRASSKDFIQALVSQASNQSAALLDTILQRLPSLTCMPHKEEVKDDLVMQIWEHPSPVYARLKNSVKDKAAQLLKHQLSVPVIRYNETFDSTMENYRWYP